MITSISVNTVKGVIDALREHHVPMTIAELQERRTHDSLPELRAARRALLRDGATLEKRRGNTIYIEFQERKLDWRFGEIIGAINSVREEKETIRAHVKRRIVEIVKANGILGLWRLDELDEPIRPIWKNGFVAECLSELREEKAVVFIDNLLVAVPGNTGTKAEKERREENE
jgi:hypothetical protein